MNIKEILKFYIKHTKGYRFFCIGLCLCLFALSFEHLVFSQIKKILIDFLDKAKDFSLDEFYIYAIQFVAVICFFESLYCFKKLFVLNSFPYINKKIIVSLYDKVQMMPYTFFQNNSPGLIVSKLRCIKRNYEELFFDLMDIVALRNFTLIVNVIALYNTNHYIGIALFIWIILFIAIMFPFFNNIIKYSYLENNILHSYMGSIANKITNFIPISTFFTFDKERNLLQSNIEKKYIPAEVRTYKQELWALIFGGILYIFMMCGVCYYVVYLKLQNIITIGDVIFIISLVFSISGTVWIIMEKCNDIVEEFGEIKSSFSIFDVEFPKFLTNEKNIFLDLKEAPKIEFKNVSFSYVDAEENKNCEIFKNFNLCIQPGEKIGIIGESGVGKTSLFSLLVKYFSCINGQILVNDIDINDISTESLRKNITIIPQHTTLFERSIMENLKYPNDNISNEEVYEVCKKVNLHDYIMKLPEGYDTVIDGTNCKMSGGQKQRIAIIRAFFKKAKIVLLDEPTSALDILTEQSVREAFSWLYKETNPTVITISHRLHAVKDLDKIVILDEGHIIEAGSHEQLLSQKDSLYSKLWEMQM